MSHCLPHTSAPTQPWTQAQPSPMQTTWPLPGTEPSTSQAAPVRLSFVCVSVCVHVCACREAPLGTHTLQCIGLTQPTPVCSSGNLVGQPLDILRCLPRATLSIPEHVVNSFPVSCFIISLLLLCCCFCCRVLADIIPPLNALGFWDTFRAWFLGLMQARPQGRLLRYDPTTKEAHVVAKVRGGGCVCNAVAPAVMLAELGGLCNVQVVAATVRTCMPGRQPQRVC